MSAEMTIPDIQGFSTTNANSVEQVNDVQPAKLVGETFNPEGQKQNTSSSLKREEVDDIVVELNSLAQNLQRSLLFSVDEKSGQTFVKVLDKETDETIREIPSKEIRDIKAKLGETIGLIFKDSS